MPFEFSLPTAILGSLASSLILACTLLYLWRLEPSQRALLYWSLAFVAQTVRMGVQLAVTFGHGHLALLGEFLFACAVVLIWLGCDKLPGDHFRYARHVTATTISVLAATLLWAIYATVAGLPFLHKTLPLYLVAGGLLIHSGWMLRRQTAVRRGDGYGVLAALFVILGVHYLDYPFLRHVTWFAPIGFGLAAALMLGIGIVMLVITQRSDRAARQESESRSRVLVDELDEGILFVDAGMRISTANPAAARILGQPLAELLLLTIDALPLRLYRSEGEPLPVQDHPLRRALQGGQATSGEVLLLERADASRIWLSINCRPLFRPGDSQPYAAILSLDDITTERAAARQLAASEQRFRSIFEGMADIAVVGYDRNGRVIYWNRACERFYGFREEEAVGAAVDALLVPEDARSAFRNELAAWINGSRQPSPAEIQACRKNGKNIRVFSTPVLISNLNGDPEIYRVDLDLSDTLQLQDELEESSERFRAIAESSELGVTVSDAQGRFIYCNPRYAELLDSSVEEILAGDWSERIHVEDREMIRERWRQAVAEKSGFNAERRVLTRDGRTLWSRAHITPIHSAHGEFRGFIGTLEDITVLKETERALRLSEAKFAGAFHASLDYITLSNLETGEILEANEAFERITGWSRGEAIGRTTGELGLWQSRQARQEAIDCLREHGHLREYPMILGTRDGGQVDGLLNASVITVDGRQYLLGVVRDVSARKRAEARLRQSEEKFHAIFDQAFQFTGLLSPDGHLLEANQTALDFAAVTRDDVIGKPFQETPWWTRSEQKARLARGIADAGAGRLVRFETMHPAPDGREHHIDFSLKPVFDGNGKVTMLIAEGRDITPLKEAEAAARESELSFSKAFHASPDFITISDIQTGEIIDVNEAFEKLTGWQRTEAIGRTSIELGLWRNPAERAEAVERLRRSGQIYEYPMQLGIRNGQALDCLLNGNIISLGERRVMFALVRDITAQRRIESALRESESKFSTMVHYSPVALVVTDAETGVLVDCNHAWQEMFGYTREQVVNRTSAEFGLWFDNADRDRLYAVLRASNGQLDRYECRYRKADGSAIFGLASGRLFDIGGRPCYLWSITDITLRHEVEQRMAQLNSELELRVAARSAELQRAQDELIRAEKLAALGALVAGIAHELNTPIGNSVTVASTLHERTAEFADLVADGTLRRSSLNAYLDTARTASDLLLRSLDQARNLVSSFKQVAVDQSSDQRRRFDLGEVVGEVLTTLSPTLRKTPFTVNLEIPEGIVLDSFPGPLGQIVTNLVGNAVTHAFDGRQRGEVGIRATTTEDGHAVLTVEDDGNGIAEENLHRIFDPFFTTRLGRGGSGLGLNIVYNIATRILGGRISVESAIGKGTSFVLTMPLSAPRAEANETP